MKQIKIKVKGEKKLVLNDCGWLMDEDFNILPIGENHIFYRKEVKVIKEGFRLPVCYPNKDMPVCYHNIQIEMIETGEKFYTMGNCLEKIECIEEKILYVPGIEEGSCNGGFSIKCYGIDCPDCFYDNINNKLWFESLQDS